MKKDDVEKAYECLKEAVAVKERNPKWDPKPTLVFNILNWLGNRGELAAVQAFISSLRPVVPSNRNLYDALMKANIRGKKDLDWIVDNMKGDGLEEDAKVEKLLKCSAER